MLEAPTHDGPMRRLLLLIAGGVLATDVLWAARGDYQIMVPAYLALAGVSAALLLGSWFYGAIRKDERLSAMLFGTAFLCAFSAGFSVLNYLLLPVAGERIDGRLAAVDQLLGVDWPSLVAFVADRPSASAFLALCYNSVLPQIALLIICLGCFGQYRAIYGFCLALALAAAITVGFWTAFPSFGPLTIYDLDPALAARANLVVGADYVLPLIGLLAEGPGRISPDQVKGLIAFPSFHAVMAVLVAWYARTLPVLNVLWAVLCGLVLLATPVHGGHFVIDLAGGIAAALTGAALGSRIAALLARPPAGARTIYAAETEGLGGVELRA